MARGSVVLAEFSGTPTNASTIARQILEKTTGDNDINVSYSQDRFIFHVKRTDGLTVLCMADDVAGSKLNSIQFYHLLFSYLDYYVKCYVSFNYNGSCENI